MARPIRNIRLAPTVSRRELLALAGAAAAPYVVPSSVWSANAPSKRINVALIGAGNQSRVDLPALLKIDDVQVVAVCDVNRGSHGYVRPEHFLGREPAQKLVNEFYAKKMGQGQYQGCGAYADLRDVLARPDVDAVAIVLPDHWHALAAVLAAKAGKDIYCQKPMTLTVADGQAMIKAVRRHGRILQTGSQYRSSAAVRKMCELVRNGRIGTVKRVLSVVSGAPVGPGPGWQPTPVPEGFDHDLWLGPAPQAPYHAELCLYRFRFRLDYSGGQITNTGAHSNDIVQWALGRDDTGPVEFEDQGSAWPPAGHLYNTATKTDFRARYADGVELICRTQDPGFGVRFEGSAGTIEYMKGKVTSQPASLVDSAIGPNEIHLPVSDNHYRNFIEAVKSRNDPIEPVEIGHRTASLCHLGNIAMRLKRKITWDPQAEQCPGDAEANTLLQRPYRPPWTL